MRSKPARRLGLACVVSAAAAAALVAPGAASAALTEQCSGGNIHGKGSSAQKNVQLNVWNPGFNSSSNAAACSGTQGSKGTPKASYTSTGSGVGLESWGVETQAGKKNSKGENEEEIRFGPENAFVGTEIAPNKAQEEEIESHGGGKVLTIPVLQAAVSIDMHLPTGCTSVTGGPSPGRIALKGSTLEKIFQGTFTKWSQILNKAKLVGSPECEKTGKLAEIHRVVREDGSGTTDSFMKYLGVLFPKAVLGAETWDQLGETTNNTVWPNEAAHPVTRGKGGGGVVAAVAATASSVGYANVSDARGNAAFVPPAGGAGKVTFWAEVERNVVKEEGKNVAVYSDPATNGEVAAKGSANCSETLYTNGKKKFPPPTTEELWNEVVAAKKQSTYADCYVSYDLALTNYQLYTKGTVKAGEPFSEPPTEGEARTVKDYLGYELSTGAGGGQPGAEGEDYTGDPSVGEPKENVLSIAQQGVSKIGY